MKRLIVLFMEIVLLVGCASANTPEKLLRPGGPFTDPWVYLDTFPIGKVTADQLVEQIGPPDDSKHLEAKTFLTYISTVRTENNRFIFTVENGIVTDVAFMSDMSIFWFGYTENTAKKRQKK